MATEMRLLTSVVLCILFWHSSTAVNSFNHTPAGVKAAPADYQNFPGVGYYKYHTTGADWNTALSTCVSEGAHLLIINSEQEVIVVQQLCDANPTATYHVHIGFQKTSTGQFVTISGESLCDAGYLHWDIGEPNNQNGVENCGSVRHSGLLNDVDCASVKNFICEFS